MKEELIDKALDVQAKEVDLAVDQLMKAILLTVQTYAELKGGDLTDDDDPIINVMLERIMGRLVLYQEKLNQLN